jgi:hypothetical protein
MGTLRRIGGTWSRYDVPGLVTLLTYEDANAITEQLGGWWRAETTLTEYRRRLEACRDALAQNWPPERSEAAAAFVQQVNATIEELNAAVGAIGRNAGALAQTDNILSLAKRDLESIHQEWQGYAIREQDAEIEAQSLTLGEVKPTGLDPDWREQLNQRARTLMSHVERDIAASAQSMVPTPSPGSYEKLATWEPSEETGNESAAGFNGSASGLSNQPHVRPPYIREPSMLVGSDSPASTGAPELAGISASDPTTAGAVGPRPLPSGPGTGSSTHGAVELAPLPAVSRPPAAPNVGEALLKIGSSQILGAPAVPGRRVNPVGGVINGEPMGATRANGLQQSPQGQQSMVPGGPGTRGVDMSNERRGSRIGTGAEEWHVSRGGPAILQPHDPGPGVIGIDR